MTRNSLSFRNRKRQDAAYLHSKTLIGICEMWCDTHALQVTPPDFMFFIRPVSGLKARSKYLLRDSHLPIQRILKMRTVVKRIYHSLPLRGQHRYYTCFPIIFRLAKAPDAADLIRIEVRINKKLAN